MEEIGFFPNSAGAEGSLISVAETIHFAVVGTVDPFSSDAMLTHITNFVHVSPTCAIPTVEIISPYFRREEGQRGSLHFEGFDIGSDSLHDPDTFVSESLINELVVFICATDAGMGDLDEDLVIFESWSGGFSGKDLACWRAFKVVNFESHFCLGTGAWRLLGGKIRMRRG